MNVNKMTQKTQEALQDAQTKAIRYGHIEIDVEHLLMALLEQADGLVARLFIKMDVLVDIFKQELEKELDRRPRVSGPGVEAGKIYVTQRLNRFLIAAEDEARRLRDEYVSVEHVVLAMLNEGRDTPSGRLFYQFNISRDRFLQALTSVRGHQRVTSAMP